MYAVGRLGSYITRGVSTVSGPFHPFGGAIDIVVVQQQDGSLKSSPWYVRFGKFQGVLKAKEKIVDINVNGSEANFHMYLNPRGEAYFLREKVGSEELDAVSLRGEESGRRERRLRPLKSKSMDYNYDQCDSLIDVGNARVFSRNLGFVLDRTADKDGSLLKEEDRAKLADTNKDDVEITSGKVESSLVLHEQRFVNGSHKESNSEVVKTVDEVIVANVDGNGNVEVYEGHGGSLENGGSEEVRLNNGPETVEEPLKVAKGSYEEVVSIREENASCSVVSLSVCRAEDGKCTSESKSSSLDSNGGFQDRPNESRLMKEEPERFVEQQFTFSDLDDAQETKLEVNQERFEGDTEGMKGSIRRFRSDNDIHKSCELVEEEAGAQAKSLPNMWSRFDRNNLDDSSFYACDPKRRPSKWAVVRKDASRIIKEGNEQLSGSKDLKDGSKAGGDALKIVDDTGKSWSLWPFKRSKSRQFSQKEQDCKKDSDIDSGSEVEVEKEGPLSKSHNMQKALTPTAEQLESLNLAEGKNTVTFTFSTPVLGNQQVDARIFLWRWDTRIVISDVDGTITKSDVLGQFMPLVGRDWSHIGVTHLFSAIKENGYQLLFLSARSISQADVTRQFLFNLKQDGKALPDGPVVISPDGLFPSLFREVIRRAPHEFKIACLEDIRACFPANWNPFYAGFGNRDTDEFSYLKVGIPKGKIFIINPKGEVVVNRCVDSKSYTSLHGIVNGIFPPVSVHEEFLGRL